MGDLALLGVRIEGHVRVERGGHALHQKLVAKLAGERVARRVEQVIHAADVERTPLRAVLGGRSA